MVLNVFKKKVDTFAAIAFGGVTISAHVTFFLLLSSALV
jgi:hypothetical protein